MMECIVRPHTAASCVSHHIQLSTVIYSCASHVDQSFKHSIHMTWCCAGARHLSQSCRC